MNGTLYLVATPIGNLEDITLRALRTLREVHLIACEDTRRTAKLLQHYGIGTPRESLHEHNEAGRIPRLLAVLREGKALALVSDAGTPLVSDPGRMLVAACIGEGIPVIPVPGPSAIVAAIAASGLPADRFSFAGFLPAKVSARRRVLAQLAPETDTLVFYEAPHRILASLEDMLAVLGPRPACLARELTKVHEEWIRGGLDRILAELKTRAGVRGEITVVVAGNQGQPAPPAAVSLNLQDHITRLENDAGLSHKEALRRAAQERGITRREAYRLLLAETNDQER